MKNLLIALILVAALLVAGCANTVNGLGALVKGVGEDLQDAASAQLDD